MNAYEEDLGEVVQVFKGACAGVAIHKRGENDNHLCFAILVEDDGNWFVSKNGFSTAWFPDLQMQMSLASEWLKRSDQTVSSDWGYELK